VLLGRALSWRGRSRLLVAAFFLETAVVATGTSTFVLIHAAAVLFFPMVAWRDLLEQDQRDSDQSDRDERKPHDNVATHILASLKEMATDEQPPAYCLYLRPFRFTSSLSVQSTESSFNSGMGGFSRPSHIDIETLFAKQFDPKIRFVALGRITEKPPSSGSARRVYLDDAEWWADFVLLVKAAAFIVVMPDPSDYCVCEASWLRAEQLLSKCIFYMRGSVRMGEIWYELEWNKSAERFEEIGIILPQYNPAGAIFTLDSTGAVREFFTLDFTRTLFRSQRLRDRLMQLGGPVRNFV